MTTDPRTVLCFGDSLTWGYDPRSGADMLRYPFAERWTRRLQAELGESLPRDRRWIERPDDGLRRPGCRPRERSCSTADVANTHMPLDLVVILLGTNDAKTFFGVNGDVIARCLGRLLEVVSKSCCGPDGKPPQTLVLVPPIMGDVRGTILEPLFDSVHSREAIQRLRETYPPIAAAFGADCLDINAVVGPGTIDGVHFDPDSLQPVATALAERIRGLFGDTAK